MLRGVFVTGTDTGVGKTVTSAALLHRFRHVPAVRYWKPIQTGIEQDDDTADVLRLSGAPEERALGEGIRLERPVSPHLAARLSGTRVDADSLVALATRQPAGHRWIVEGAGGVLVPLNERDLMVDLIGRLALGVVIASRSGLGTINHTLLTIEALRARALPIAGVVMVGPPDEENRLAIERYGSVQVVGQLPRLEPLTPAGLRELADRAAFAAALERWFA